MKFSPSTNSFYLTEIHGANIPPDTVEITNEEHAVLIAGQSLGMCIAADANGYPVLQNPPPPTTEQIIAQYESALDAHLDSVAKQYRYDDRKSFALRAAYAGPYHAEGTAFGQWMDACNAASYALLLDVHAGTVPMPTIEDFIAGLPAFVSP